MRCSWNSGLNCPLSYQQPTHKLGLCLEYNKSATVLKEKLTLTFSWLTHIRLGLHVHFHANILEICWFASKLLQMREQAALESQELSLFCSVIKHIWCDCKEERILQNVFAQFDWWMVTATFEMMVQHIKTMRQWAILQKSCRCSLLCVGT